jgi:spermidine/putrescine transport system substrate-binding protein
MAHGPLLHVGLSRRALLVRGGQAAGALALLGLVGCGGDDDDEEGTTSAAATGAATSAAATSGDAGTASGAAGGLTKEQIASATGEVRTLVWQGYDDAALYAGMQGVTLKPGYLTQNEDVLTKARVGDQAQFDLMTIFQGYIDPLLELEAIQPIDPALLTNYSQLFPYFKEDEAFKRDGQLYSVPFLWGTMQVNYNADEVDKPETFDDLMDPSLKGRIALNDDTYSAITQFARFAGAENPNHLTPEELEETMALLDSFRPQVAGIAPGPEVAGFLTRKDAVVALPDWTPTIITAKAAGINLQPTMPALSFVDGWLAVSGAGNLAAGYKLIDQAISVDSQAAAGEALGLGVVNEQAVAKLPQEMQDAWPYDSVDTLLAEAPAYPGVPVKSDEFATLQDWVKAWEEFKVKL